MTESLQLLRRHYDRVWCVDFEYFPGSSGADAPTPICAVAHEVFSGAVIRKWLWAVPTPKCPYETDERSLFVSFYASAEITCHLSLGWPTPKRILDLHAEFRLIANADSACRSYLKKVQEGTSRFVLLNCMRTFGLHAEAVSAGYKDASRDLCIRGGPYSSAEQKQIIEYCHSDVAALVKLLPRMLPRIDLKFALFRGRYGAAVGHMERRGVPVDAPLVDRFKSKWTEIVPRLIAEYADEFDVIGNRDVDREKLAKWLYDRKLLDIWPRYNAGVRGLKTDSDTFVEMARFSPDVMRLKEMLGAVRRTRLFDKLRVGSDGRNRFLLSPFGSKTGRNQPSNAQSVFGPSCWVRTFIQPPPGYALLYCDWSGQEYGIAAFFSGDEKMMSDYLNDDPYLGFAKRINLVPADATKKTHSVVRNQLKIAAGLGVLYGAQAPTVAKAGDMCLTMAETVLRKHRYTYRQFWKWRQQMIDHAQLRGELQTGLGWKWQVLGTDSINSISNWPMQSNGAEMLRIACCLATERGIEVCTPVHDALLVQAPVEAIQEVRAATKECMEEASAIVLKGARLKIGIDDPVAYPARFSDARGVEMWRTLTQLLEGLENPKV